MAKNRFDIFEVESKTNMIILGIGVLAVFTIAFMLLQNIWTSPSKNNVLDEQVESNNDEKVDTKSDNSTNFGSYINISGGEEKILKEYFSYIFVTLSSGTEEEVYNITSNDYIQKHGYDVSTLYEALKKKGIVGKAFQCTKYYVEDNPRFGKVFSLEISSIDKKTIDKLMIIESSPRHYKLSYDSYIGKKNINIEKIREGLKLSITEAEEYKDRVYFTVKFENVSTSNITLNSEMKAPEPVYVKLTNGKVVYNTSDWFISSKRVLTPNQSIQAKVQFLTTDLQGANIKYLNVVSVHRDDTNTTSNFEFELY